MTENFNNQNNALLRRAFMLLEDGEWEKADEYAEKVLDNEPENSNAYLCKLLSELRVAHIDLLYSIPTDISKSRNYINALKYADARQKNFLENCAHKAHARFLERQEIESNRETINTFSSIIETYRDTQRRNRKMIKRGKSAVNMYLISYILCIVFIAAVIIVSNLKLGGDNYYLILPLAQGVIFPTFAILLWAGHARLVRFWDLDYGDDRGWTMPYFYGMINTLFTLGIWGLVKSIKTRKECNSLISNNEEMERQISDLKQSIDKTKASVKKYG